MVNTKDEQYSTSDTALASYLITEGFKLLEIDYSNPRFVFSFPKNNSKKVQEYASKYITGNALVDPATYTRVSRKLSRIVRNHMQWWDES